MTITTDKLERQIDTISVINGQLAICRDRLRTDNTQPMEGVTDATRSLLSAMLALNMALVELSGAHADIASQG